MLKLFCAVVSGILLLLFIGIAIYTSRASGLLHAYSPLDDAYMFERYASNILNGEGIAWNAGEPPTYGVSSVSYLFVVTLAKFLLPLNPSVLLQTLSLSFGIAFALAMAWVGRSVCHTDFMRAFSPILLLILCFVFGSESFLFHSLSGMETTFALLVNTALIGLVFWMLRAPSSFRCFVVALAGLVCYDTRPDNGLYALLFPALAIFLLGPQDRRLRLLASFCASFLVLLLVDMALKMAYLGSPLPLSFYVKSMGYYEGYAGHRRWNAVAFIFVFLRLVLPFLVLLLFTARRKHLPLLAACFVPVILHFAYLFTVEQITGNDARYYYPALPFFILPALITLDDFLAERKNAIPLTLSQSVRPFAIAIVVIAIASPLIGDRISGFFRIYVLEREDRPYQTREKTPNFPELNWSESLAAISGAIARLPAGTVVALSEVGYPSVVAPQVKIIDISGLNDAEMVRQHVSVQHILAERPDLIWLPHSDYTKLVVAFLGSEELHRDYDLYPDAFDYGIAIRKDSPQRSAVLHQLRAAWQKAYPAGTPPPF